MNKNPPDRPALAFVLRNSVETLTVFLILIVLQTGLVPFLATPSGGAGGSNDFFRFDSSSFTLPDIVSNIFLYIPVGVLLYWSAVRALGKAFSALLVCVGLSAALSGGIEWIQAYIPARVSSVTDFASNLTGAGLGICIAGAGRMLGPRLLGAVIVEFRQHPLAAAIKAYCCALLLTAVIPFSFSLDPGLLKRSLKTVHYKPFESVQVLRQEAQTAMGAGHYRQYVDATWRAERCWAGWAAEAASFAVLAWLLLALLRDRFGFGPVAATALMAWFCGLLAVALSVVQIPILTRSVDVTDILFRFAGAFLGMAGRSIHSTVSTRIPSADWPVYARRLASVGCAVVGLYILSVGLMPFLFDAGPAGPRQSLGSIYLLPFFGTFETRFDLLIADVLEKLILYFLFAFLLVSCSRRLQDCSVGKRVLCVTVAGIFLATAIEIAQMYIVVRITSITDLILAAAGCTAGVVGREQVIAVCHYAMTCAEPPSRPGSFHSITSSMPTTTDALISTLFEPHPQAPTEPAPHEKVQPRTRRSK